MRLDSVGSSPLMADNSDFVAQGMFVRPPRLRLHMELGPSLELWSNVGHPWHWGCE